MHRSESEHPLEMGDASLKGAPKRRCMLACKSLKSAVLSICILHIKVWLFCQYSWNGCTCLFWISAPHGTATAVHHLPKKSRKRLAYDVIHTSATNAGPVHHVKDNNHWLFSQLAMLIFNKPHKSTEKLPWVYLLLHSYQQGSWCFFAWCPL